MKKKFSVKMLLPILMNRKPADPEFHDESGDLIARGKGPGLTDARRLMPEVKMGRAVEVKRVPEDPLDVLVRKFEGLHMGEPTPSPSGTTMDAQPDAGMEDDDHAMQAAVKARDAVDARETRRNRRRVQKFDRLVGK